MQKSRPPAVTFAFAGELYVCAGHGALLHRCKSYGQVFAEPKARRRARASPRGGVWRKPNPKRRGDEPKPDSRRDAPGASGHVTAKPSICGWGAFGKSGVYAAKVTGLTPGDLSCGTLKLARLERFTALVMLAMQLPKGGSQTAT